MQNQPLLLSSLLKHADRFHSGTEIVSRTVEGPIHRYTYGDAARSHAETWPTRCAVMALHQATGSPRLPGTIIGTSRSSTASPVLVRCGMRSIHG